MQPRINDKRLPQELRHRLETRREAMLAALRAEHARSGRILYDTEWVEPAAARKRHRLRLLKHLWQLLELVFVSLLGLLFTALCLVLIAGVSGAKFTA